MKNVFSGIKEHFEKKFNVTVIAFLLLASIGANLYLVYDRNYVDKDTIASKNSEIVKRVETAEFETPFGMRSEIYTRYEDGKWKTYSTSTPITEEEILKMRKESLDRQRAMREYFRKQDELMREFRESFWL